MLLMIGLIVIVELCCYSCCYCIVAGVCVCVCLMTSCWLKLLVQGFLVLTEMATCLITFMHLFSSSSSRRSPVRSW